MTVNLALDKEIGMDAAVTACLNLDGTLALNLARV